ARFYSPEGLAVDSSGTLYIADEGDIIRKGVAYNGAPFISTQPQGTTIHDEASAQFSIAVYGYTSSELALLRYQWQRKPAASNTWTNLASDGTYLGATTNSLTVRAATASMNGDEFRCVVTGPTGSTTSERVLKMP